MEVEARCLFCGGPRGGPDHACSGRQGHVEAEEPVLDPVRAHAVTEAGVRQSGDRAAEDWKQDMHAAIYVIARRQPLLTSDDLWNEVGAAAVTEQNPSALGSVFRTAAKDGLIRLTGDRQESQRPAHHRKPLRVWRSLIHISTVFPQG